MANSAVVGKKVILVMVDACRWDYPDENPEYRGFRTLERDGVRAQYMNPIFPSNSYPNWYTIVTGLYAENHGIMDNYMYDQQSKLIFSMAPVPSAPFWWEEAEPLWITAQKNGVNTAVYRWDGCQHPRNGISPKICTKYTMELDYNKLNEEIGVIFKDVVTMMSKDELQLALVYYDPVDLAGHAYGPDSTERKQALAGVDKLIFQLQLDLKAKNLQDKVNVIVLADHGMTGVDPSNTVKIDLDPFESNIQYLLNGIAFAMILPEPGKTQELYADLKKLEHESFHVYLKEEIPEKYHIAKNNRTLPIVLIADPGYAIFQLSDGKKCIPFPSGFQYKGVHGYDPDISKDMRAIFYASGPSVKSSYKSGPIEMTDVYNLACHMLGITARPNNGSLDRIKGMLSATASACTPK